MKDENLSLTEQAARYEALHNADGAALALALRKVANARHLLTQTSLKGRVYAALEAAHWRPEHAIRAAERELEHLNAQIEAARTGRMHAALLASDTNSALSGVRADLHRQRESLMNDKHAAEHKLRRLTDQRRAAVATLTAAGLTTDEAEARAKPTADEVAAAAERAEAALPAQIAAVDARAKDVVGLATEAEARQRAEAAAAASKAKERERARAQARIEAAADAAVAAAEV
jgi:chromosome segregation ATPase